MKEQGKSDQARECYQKAIAVNPNFAEAHGNLGSLLYDQDKFDEAKTTLNKAISIKPAYAEAHYNLGNVFGQLDNLDEALVCYQTALSHQPDYVECHNNIGNVYKELGRHDEALASYRKAISLKPDYAEAIHNQGMLELLKGDLQAGWGNYNYRLLLEDFTSHHSTIPSVPSHDHSPNLESLTDQKILVWMEQGIGDEIMFASMLPDLDEIAKKVAVECDERVIPIFQRSFPGITFISRGASSSDELSKGEFDFQMPAGNLGSLFRTQFSTFPENKSFLIPNEALKNRIHEDYRARWPDKLRVGISWRSGNITSGTKRSLLLDHWTPILSNEKCRFINLQYGDVEEELGEFKEKSGIDVFIDPNVDPLKDMESFAAQVACRHLSGSFSY